MSINIPRVGDEVGEFFEGTVYPTGTKFVTATNDVNPDHVHSFYPVYNNGELICFTFGANYNHYVAIPNTKGTFDILTVKVPKMYYVGVYYNHSDEDFKSKTLLYSKGFLSQDASDEYETSVLDRHTDETNISVQTWVSEAFGV